MRGQELLVPRPALICGVVDHRTIGNRAPTKQIHASFFLMTIPIVVSLWDELGAPPDRSERLVHSRFGIGRNVSAVRASQHDVHLGWVGQQAGRGRLSQHPFERDFRQAALRLWITATDIAVNAGEPNQHNVFWSPGFGRAPEIWSEERSSFVDRYRMPANLNIWVVCSVGESERVFDPAYGIHGVPYADEIWLARRSGKMRLEFIRQFEECAHLRRLLGLWARSIYGHQHADGIRHKRFVSFSDQAVHVKQRGNGAYRVCASTKAEQKEPIAFLKIVHKEDVRVANIRFEAVTDCSPGQFGELAAEGGERARSLHRA